MLKLILFHRSVVLSSAFFLIQSCQKDLSLRSVGEGSKNSHDLNAGDQKSQSDEASAKVENAATASPQFSEEKKQDGKTPKEGISLLVPITPFANMASGYQATNPGFFVFLKNESGKLIASGPMSIKAAMNGFVDDASKGTSYGRLVLNIELNSFDKELISQSEGLGYLSICMRQEESKCKSLSGNIHPERPFQWVDKKVRFEYEKSKIKIIEYFGDTGEGGSSEQISLAVYHPAFAFASPGVSFNDFQSPIVLDWSRNGQFSFIDVWDPSHVVFFDFTGEGKKVRTGWIKNTHAFLALDLYDDGIVHDGKQLFGEYSKSLQPEKIFSNGFEALAQYDVNHDQKINRKDPIWKDLRIWVNTAEDGNGKNDKLIKISDIDVEEISLIYAQVPKNQQTVNGNEMRLVSEYRTNKGKTYFVGDIWFKNRSINSLANQ